MRSIVLASGLGERMAAFTGWLPKPLLPLGPKPMIEWALEPIFALRWLYGCVEITANNANADALRAWQAARATVPIVVQIVDKPKEKRVSSKPVADLLCVLKSTGEPEMPTLVGVCDNVWRTPPHVSMAALMSETLLARLDDLAVVGYSIEVLPEDGARLGSLTLDSIDGACVVREFVEKPGSAFKIEDARVFFAPFVLLPRGVEVARKHAAATTIGELIGALAAEGVVRAVRFDARIVDVGEPAAYKRERDRVERESENGF